MWRGEGVGCGKGVWGGSDVERRGGEEIGGAEKKCERVWGVGKGSESCGRMREGRTYHVWPLLRWGPDHEMRLICPNPQKTG